MLEQLQKDQIAVVEVKEIVEVEEQKVRLDTEMVERYAAQAELDLKNVIPILDEAMADVSQLDKADVAEVRVYQSPPYQVMMVMCAVCVLLGCKPDWPTARQVLGDSGFISRLTNLDINNISDRVRSTHRRSMTFVSSLDLSETSAILSSSSIHAGYHRQGLLGMSIILQMGQPNASDPDQPY